MIHRTMSLETAVTAEVDQLLAMLRNLKRNNPEQVAGNFLLTFTAQLCKVPDDPDDIRGPLCALIADLLGRLI